ncbi:MAG TPA: hypothetical protein VIG45_01720 [Erysipelothrix sp.]
MKKKLQLILLLLIVITMPIINIQALDKTIQLETQLSLNEEKIVAGEKNHLNVAFKLTGAQTILHNFEARLSLGEHFVFDAAMMQQLPQEFNYELNQNNLILTAESVEAGQYFNLPIMFNTVNGLIPNNQQETIVFTVHADNFEAQSFEKSVYIAASSPLKLNKDYTGIYDEILNGSQGITPNLMGQWETRAAIHKKDYGQMFIKEKTTITITETFSDYLDFVEVLDGPSPDVIEDNKLVWYFDAPSYENQTQAEEFLFFQKFKVIYKVKDIEVVDKIEGIGSKATLSFVNIANETLSDEDEALTTIYPSQENTPKVEGNWWVPGHFGPADAFGHHSIDFAAMNKMPTVYPWATLQFAHQIASFEHGQNERYEAYEINYYVNDHLDLKSLKTPGQFGYRPNREHGDATPLLEQPILNLKIYNDQGVEIAYFEHVAQNRVITKAEILAQNNFPQETIIKHIQYAFEKTVPGMIVDEPDDIGPNDVTQLPTYQFKVRPSWKEAAQNNMTVLDNEMDIKTVINDEGFIRTEFYDFKKDAEDRDFVVTHHSGIVETRSEGFHFLSAPRWAHVTEDEIAYVPTVSNTIALTDHRDGHIYEGKNKLHVSLNNHNVGLGGVLENIVSYLYVPKQIDLAKISDYSLNNQAEFIRLEAGDFGDFNLYQLNWRNDQLAPGESMFVDFDVTVTGNKAELTMYHFTDMLDHDDYHTFKVAAGNILDSDKVSRPELLNGITETDTVVKTGNHYRMSTYEQLTVEKFVKAASDTTFKKSTQMKANETLTYKLSMRNPQDKEINELVLLDVLPHINDFGITDFVDRNSEFTLVLNQALNIDETKFEVYYSEAKNPSRAVLNDAVKVEGYKLIENNTEETIWKTKEAVDDFTKIHSFMLKLKEGQSIAANESFDLTFTTVVANQESINQKVLMGETLWAHNSFAMSVNGSPVIEPLQVSVTILGEQTVKPEEPKPEEPKPEQPKPEKPKEEDKGTTRLPQTGKSNVIFNSSILMVIFGVFMKKIAKKN